MSLNFDVDKYREGGNEKFGQSLQALVDEEVTVDNIENYRKRIEAYCGQIGDDISELQKEIKRIESTLEKIKDDVGDERLSAYRDNNKDLIDFSIDAEDTLAYRRLKKLKKIENKRSYKSAHWKLLALKQEEIIERMQTIDAVVKKRIESSKAEIVNEIESSRQAILDTVEQEADALEREHGQIQRYQKSNLNLTQEISQQFSLNFDAGLTDGMVDTDSGKVEPADGVGDSEQSSNPVSSDASEDDTRETGFDEDYELPFEFKGKSDKERKEELDRMVELVDNIEEKSKSDVVDLVDMTRQQFYYSGDGGIPGEIEEKFGVEYPEI